jgi:magnesium transporter
LLINLLTVFGAAAVVGYFQDTIDRVVVLAAFLPVLSGQCGNLGAQSLAVTIRGMTLGELRGMPLGGLMLKEAWLGLLNGTVTGALAGAGMFFAARSQALDNAFGLGLVTLAAMAIACLLSGLAGVVIPILMRRFGADPATASAIFLSTITDISSMAFFLAFATWLLP